MTELMAEQPDRRLMDRIRTVYISIALLRKALEPYIDELDSELTATQFRMIGDVFVELVEVLPAVAADMVLRAEVLDPGGTL